MRVNTRYADANRNGHRLICGGVLGVHSIDLSASATALCPSSPTLSQISTTVPARTAIVTMGQACTPGFGLAATCYLATPQGNPIVRADNWNPCPAVITVRIMFQARFVGNVQFTAPAAGQFWVVVPGVQMNGAADGAPVENIVFRIIASCPSVPANRINTTGTATYNNRFNSSVTLLASALCADSGRAAASRLPG